jgi:hypothetical protein
MLPVRAADRARPLRLTRGAPQREEERIISIAPKPALAPPRAAAVAGVLFAVLMSACLIVVRLAVPAPQDDPGEWLNDPVRRSAVRFAVNLAPFAGIAFLWFIGVLRGRLGALEDQFFATVFLGSGLLFVASLFASTAFTAALVGATENGRSHLLSGDTYYLTRQLVSTFVNVFGIKMAGVFIMSTSTIVLRTSILPRWVAFSGFACAAVLLVAITTWPWIALLFPFWMFVISLRILLSEFGIIRQPVPQAGP